MGGPRGGGSNEPKGKMSAYAFFVQAEREKGLGDRSFLEHMRACGLTWHGMTKSERKPFMEQEKRDKKRFETEMRDYVPPAGDKGMKKVKTLKAPKKPRSAFWSWFTSDKRKQMEEANPDFGVADVAKELRRMWREINPTNKKKYEAMAARDKARYQKEMEAYSKRLARAPTKGHLCVMCGEMKSTASGLTEHVARSHLEEYWFECFLCSDQFKVQLDLEDHLRTHTNEKPYL